MLEKIKLCSSSSEIPRIGPNLARRGIFPAAGEDYPNRETLTRKLGALSPAGKGKAFLAEFSKLLTQNGVKRAKKGEKL